PRENADFPAADCGVMVGWASQHAAAISNASVQVKNFIGHIQRESMSLTVTGESTSWPRQVVARARSMDASPESRTHKLLSVGRAPPSAVQDGPEIDRNLPIAA